MSGLGFTFDGVAEMEKVTDKITRVISGSRTKILRDFSDRMLFYVQQRIKQQKGEPDYTPWRPWTAAYAKRKKTNKFLEESGDLLKSLRNSVERDFVNGDAAIVYTDLIYAEPNDKMREFMGLSNRESDELCEVLADEIARAWEAA